MVCSIKVEEATVVKTLCVAMFCLICQAECKQLLKLNHKNDIHYDYLKLHNQAALNTQV